MNRTNKERNNPKRTNSMKNNNSSNKAGELHGVFGNATDYRFYHMNALEIIAGYIGGAFFWGVIAFLFFRTPIVYVPVGIAGGFMGVSTMRKYRKKKRDSELLDQFRALLESLATSFSANKNTKDAFIESREDLRNMYSEKSNIIKEIDLILMGVNNNRTIECMLSDFALRSGLEDIVTFADVFCETSRLSGTMHEVVENSRSIISEKIDTEREINASIENCRFEFRFMLCIPLLILCFMNVNSDFSIASNEKSYVYLKLAVCTVLAAAALLGRKILKIKA